MSMRLLIIYLNELPNIFYTQSLVSTGFGIKLVSVRIGMKWNAEKSKQIID